MTEWIDANGELPPEGQQVLVWIKDGWTRGSDCAGIGNYSYGRFYIDGYNGSWNVTHWAVILAPDV